MRLCNYIVNSLIDDETWAYESSKDEERYEKVDDCYENNNNSL